MAQQVVVEMVDDLDGTVGEDVTTVSFALDGRIYEIDLCERNAEKLRNGLAEYIDASRRQRGGRAARRARGASSNADVGARQRAQAIREWAQSAGHQLSERGRIPANVVEAYEQAQQGGASAAPAKDKPSAAKPAKRATAKAPAKSTEAKTGEPKTTEAKTTTAKAAAKPAVKPAARATSKATSKAADNGAQKAEEKAPRKSSRKAKAVDLPSFSG
jgi:nucleoid-associated protein Lsr2